MTLETMNQLLRDAGFVTDISGDAANPIVVTFARVEGSPATIPLFVSWVPEKGLWKLASFPYATKRPPDKYAAERLLEIYSALDLVPMFIADEWGCWQIGGMRYISGEDVAAKAMAFLEAIKTLQQMAVKGGVNFVDTMA